MTFRLPESPGDGEFIVATYLYRAAPGVDIERAAQGLADLQSTGTWVPPASDATDIRERHGGRVIGLWQVPDHELGDEPTLDADDWVIQIAFPRHNVGDQLPLLLATVYGECASSGLVKLIDLALPVGYTRTFPGPQFGIAGLRDRLGVHDRPLVLVMMKPSLGLSPTESADVFRELALGGADAVKDDELLVSHPWSELTDRVRAHALAARQASEVSGRTTLFFANVTDRPDRMLDNARRAVDAGATGLMVDYLTTGISALSMLADEPGVDVPILAHLAFAGAHYASPRSGVSSHRRAWQVAAPGRRGSGRLPLAVRQPAVRTLEAPAPGDGASCPDARHRACAPGTGRWRAPGTRPAAAERPRDRPRRRRGRRGSRASDGPRGRGSGHAPGHRRERARGGACGSGCPTSGAAGRA